MRWPERAAVRQSVAAWAEALIESRPEVLAVGAFGSLVREDWGVGSDADVVVLVEEPADTAFSQRGASFDSRTVPVPTDVLVYTAQEWAAAADRDPFMRRVHREVEWVGVRSGAAYSISPACRRGGELPPAAQSG